MNPRHYLAHVLLQHHPAPRNHTAMAEAVKEHFAKTLSAEALTNTLRDRLGKKRERATVHEELTRLENELAVIGEIKDARIVMLRQKVQELQKKVRSRPTGPSP